MVKEQRWGLVRVLGPDGAELAVRSLSGGRAPDLESVDLVARLLLQAKRLGGRIVLTEVSPSLWALLELSGLRVEVERQAELGEESLGVQEGQEEAHVGDLPL
jgi:hypothetical protein